MNNRYKRFSIYKPKRTMIIPKIKVKGMIWEFHKGDSDYRPSVPHGHSLDRKYKLQLWNGYIYDVQTGQHIYTAKKKDMEALYNFPGFLDFVIECRQEYKKRNPAISLPELTCKQSKVKTAIKCTFPEDKKDHFVFFITYENINC